MSYQEPKPAQPSESPQYPSGAPEFPPLSQDERMWGMLCHLAGLLYFTAVPFANIIGPLVLWLLKKDEMPWVDQNGKESLNFQISIAIYTLVSALLILAVVGFVLLPAVIIFNLVACIIAAIKANAGEAYRYPLCIRFLS
jgi:uncharacterized Tic20 family protein